MPSYRELLQQVKSEIDEIDVPSAAELRESEPPVFVDVRDRNEWDEGHIPGAVHVPRGNLESRIEGAVPDRDAQIVVYCASGARSAFAAKALEELGYENVVLARRRVQRMEAKRLRLRPSARARRAEAAPLLAPPPHPRGRRGGAAAAARLAHPPDRRRWARLARVALPGRGRRRHDRDRRRRRRGRLQPPAPDRPLDRAAGRARRPSRPSGRSRRSTPT